MGFRDWLRGSKRADKPQAARPPGRRIAVVKRGYGAASIDRLHNTFSNTPRTFDSHLFASLRTLRARSREAARDNPLAKRFLGLLTRNVIGSDGIILQSRPRDDDGTQDKLAAQAIEEAWRDWSKPRHCDITGRRSWTTLQRLALRHVARDGEALIEEVTGADAGPYGYALQVKDPELLDVNLNKQLSGGRRIVMGVELDRYDRRLAYHLFDPYDLASTSVIDGYYHDGYAHRRVEASRIIHLFLDEDGAQTRGQPWMHAALDRTMQLDGGIEAAVVNFRVGANKLGFVTTKEGEAPPTSGEEADGSPLEDLEPATITVLEEGQSFTSWDPPYPDAALEPFVKGIKRDISSALEISYNSLSSDLEGVSFSAGRLGRLDDVDLWQMVQSWLSLALHQRVFDRFLELAILAGKIGVPSRDPGTPLRPLNADKIEKYRRARWQGRGFESVDALKTSMAIGNDIALGLTTVSAEIRKRGRDPEELFAERAEELAELDKLGIRPPEPATADMMAAATTDEGDAPANGRN